MTCTRCNGLLAIGYDELERAEFLKCINCGARPYQQAIRVDGCEHGDPLRCVDCKVQPRERIKDGYARGTEHEINRCKECRIRYNMKTRMQKQLRAQRAQVESGGTH